MTCCSYRTRTFSWIITQKHVMCLTNFCFPALSVSRRAGNARLEPILSDLSFRWTKHNSSPSVLWLWPPVWPNQIRAAGKHKHSERRENKAQMINDTHTHAWTHTDRVSLPETNAALMQGCSHTHTHREWRWPITFDCSTLSNEGSFASVKYV